MQRVPMLPLALTAACFAFQPFTASADAASQVRSQTSLIDDVHVTPETSGLGPDLFAYRVLAHVLVGANACEATGVRVGLVRHWEDGVLTLMPTRLLPRGPQPICAKDYQPVYRDVETVVRGRISKTEDVVIANIGHDGTRTSIQDLIAENAGASLTGTLTRAMAVGAESSGYALELPSGETVELDLKTGGFAHQAQSLAGNKVTVTGVYKTVTGVELTRKILEVTALSKKS